MSSVSQELYPTLMGYRGRKAYKCQPQSHLSGTSVKDKVCVRILYVGPINQYLVRPRSPQAILVGRKSDRNWSGIAVWLPKAVRTCVMECPVTMCLAGFHATVTRERGQENRLPQYVRSLNRVLIACINSSGSTLDWLVSDTAGLADGHPSPRYLGVGRRREIIGC